MKQFLVDKVYIIHLPDKTSLIESGNMLFRIVLFSDTAMQEKGFPHFLFWKERAICKVKKLNLKGFDRFYFGSVIWFSSTSALTYVTKTDEWKWEWVMLLENSLSLWCWGCEARSFRKSNNRFKQDLGPAQELHYSPSNLHE